MEGLSISLNKIKNRILNGNEKSLPLLSIRENDSFKINETPFDGYVEPLFTSQPTSNGGSDYSESKIIFISAPGATGKSAMTKHLSNALNLPVFDLGKHEPVGSYSLLGMLYKTLSPQDMAMFMQGLTDGTRTMLIDAFDEGYVKSGHAAFESFLQDLAQIALVAKGLPFVIFGRTNILEYATLFFEENHVPVSLLQIEPFTIPQAQKFVDNQMDSQIINKYAMDYKQVRDYIIRSIEGFFKNESEISKKMYERFIGYAPVLQSIASLLNDKGCNYHALLQELQEGNYRNVDLVQRILCQILERERSKYEEALEPLLSGRTHKFCADIRKNAYSIEEQCLRLLYSSIGIKCDDYQLSMDEDFNKEYEKSIETWFCEHPFKTMKGGFQNVVFESFVLSKIIADGRHEELVLRYLKTCSKGMSYLFFDLFKAMNGNNLVKTEYLPYLIESYQMMDRTDDKGRIDIAEYEDNEGAKCHVEFSREKSGVEYEFDLIMNSATPIPLGRVVSNLSIDASVSVVIDSPSVEFITPVYIRCKELYFNHEEMVLTASGSDRDVVVEADNIITQSKSGKLQTITNNGNVDLKLLTDAVLYFPYVNYQGGVVEQLGMDSTLQEKYQKMRHILMHFRSGHKGVLAKYKYKISNRICANELGQSVLRALLNSGVIVEEDEMYYIDSNKLSAILCVNFSGLRTCQINPEIKTFLNSIK